MDPNRPLISSAPDMPAQIDTARFPPRGQQLILIALSRRATATVAELARDLRMKPDTVQTHVSRLHKAAYLVNLSAEPRPKSGRVYSLTPAGQKFLAALATVTEGQRRTLPTKTAEANA